MGHSTHPLERLVELLREHGVEVLADVRRFPGSRRLPQFNEESLAAALPAAGVEYVHIGELGGRRRALPGSPNTGWRVEGFRGYADHMASAEFAAGLERLEALGDERPTAVMCAEAMWFRCHRRLVADALTVRGRPVEHILPDGRLQAHELPAFALVSEDGRLSYPAEQGELPIR